MYLKPLQKLHLGERKTEMEKNAPYCKTSEFAIVEFARKN